MQSVPSRGHPAHSQTLNRVTPESRGLDFRSLAWSEALRAPVRPGWTRRATSLQQPPTRATPTGPSKGAAQRGSPGSLPAPLATTLRSRTSPDPVFWSLALALDKESHKAPNKLRLPFPGAGCPGAEAPAQPSHPRRAQSRRPAGPRSRSEARRPLRRAGGEAAPGERGCRPGADLVEVGAPRHGVAALVGVAAAGGFRLHGGWRARTLAAGGCCWGARARLRRRWRPRQQRAGGRGRAWVARGGGRGGRSRCPQPGGRREALSHGRRSGERASEEEVAAPGARASRLDNHHDPSSPCPRGARLSAAHGVPSWPQRPPCGVRPGPPSGFAGAITPGRGGRAKGGGRGRLLRPGGGPRDGGLLRWPQGLFAEDLDWVMRIRLHPSILVRFFEGLYPKTWVPTMPGDQGAWGWKEPTLTQKAQARVELGVSQEGSAGRMSL